MKAHISYLVKLPDKDVVDVSMVHGEEEAKQLAIAYWESDEPDTDDSYDEVVDDGSFVSENISSDLQPIVDEMMKENTTDTQIRAYDIIIHIDNLSVFANHKRVYLITDDDHNITAETENGTIFECKELMAKNHKSDSPASL